MIKFLLFLEFIFLSISLSAQRANFYRCHNLYGDTRVCVLKSHEIKLLWKLEDYTKSCRKNFHQFKTLIGEDSILDRLSNMIDEAYPGALSEKGEVIFSSLLTEPHRNRAVIIIADTAEIFHLPFYGSSLKSFLKSKKDGYVLGKTLTTRTPVIVVQKRDSWLSETINLIHEFYHLYLAKNHIKSTVYNEEKVIRLYTASLLLRAYNQNSGLSLIKMSKNSPLNFTVAQSPSIEQMVFDINDKFEIDQSPENLSEIYGEIYFFCLVKQLENTIRECEIEEHLIRLGY